MRGAGTANAMPTKADVDTDTADGHPLRQPVWKAASVAATGAGVTAALAAAAYDAVVRAGSGSDWRELLGPLGWISILSALIAVVVGLLVLPSRHARIGTAAAALGAMTLAYWVWVMSGILKTT